MRTTHYLFFDLKAMKRRQKKIIRSHSYAAHTIKTKNISKEQNMYKQSTLHFEDCSMSCIVKVEMLPNLTNAAVTILCMVTTASHFKCSQPSDLVPACLRINCTISASYLYLPKPDCAVHGVFTFIQ